MTENKSTEMKSFEQIVKDIGINEDIKTLNHIEASKETMDEFRKFCELNKENIRRLSDAIKNFGVTCTDACKGIIELKRELEKLKNEQSKP